MLSFLSITKRFEGEPVLERVSFTVRDGEKVGLVGPNGSGKSTLLKIAAGIIAVDDGAVQIGKGETVGRLSQEMESRWNDTSAETYLFENAPESKKRHRALQLLGAFGLDATFLGKTIGRMSGGEKSKLGLTRVFSVAHDTYLLDEPTNNLDLPGIIALERIMSELPKAAFLIVSHDRKLLDRVCGTVVELDERGQGAIVYDGNFSAYMKQREVNRARHRSDYHDYRDEVERLQDSARKKQEWASKGIAKPRTTDNDKYIKGFRAEHSAKLASVAKGIEKRIERLEEVERPVDELPVKLEFDARERSGTLVFRCLGAEKRFADRRIGPIDLDIVFGDRVALIGKNGAGKTTLLKLLTGEIAPDGGEVKRGTRLVLGLLPQEHSFTEDLSLLEHAQSFVRIDESNLRKTLNRFGFGGDAVHKRVMDLSPGQRSRLILAEVMLQRANCLILDEPSNHLDLEALEALEGALRDFQGTLIVVTHDRYFLDVIKPNKTLLIQDDGSLKQVSDYHVYESR